MPIKDTQGDLSAKGTGAFDGLPPSGFTIEVVTDNDDPNGTNARKGGGSISTDRTSENH
jgi:hypothetical protein